jgi:hypothetical protein
VPVYELTVLRGHGETESRYTDIAPAVGDTVRIGGRRALIVSRHPDPINEAAVARFVCWLLADEPSDSRARRRRR